jgi:hypothetical protein
LRWLILGQAELIGDVCGAFSSLVSSPLGIRRVPVPGRRDRGGGPVVRAHWLSYRDVEELLAERGIEVDHGTRRLAPPSIAAVRRIRPQAVEE